MARTETVAVVTMLCDAKRALIPLLTPRWDAIDYGGRRVVYVAVTNDASPETVNAFQCATKRPVVPVSLNNLADYVPDLEHEKDVRPQEYASNIIFLHRMAMLREAARQAVLKLRDGQGRPVDWVYWLDQDVDPRAHSFLSLHGVLTKNRGPQAPRVAAGLYCTRNWGQDITQWLGDDTAKMGRYIPIIRDQVQSSRVAGFGCCLMRRSTMAKVGFDSYTAYREFRRWQREINRPDTEGVMGEDIWWFRQYEQTYGTAPLIDNRVRCRHYHADGSYWRYVETGNGTLRPDYCTDEVIPGVGVPVRNVGAEVIELRDYKLRLAPGEECRVSTEIAHSLRHMDLKVEVYDGIAA